MSKTEKSVTQCRNCGARLVQKATRKKASQKQQAYYYTAYYACPKCHRLYHDDKFKVVNKPQTVLFEKTLGETEQNGRNIWTDGACTHNGTHRAKAAWAFVSGDYEESGLVEGKQTNNTAEATAILRALEWAGDNGFQAVTIHTDSQITIHGLQKPVEKIKENRDIFQKIADVIAKYSLTVSYKKVLGHAGDINNERADKLANQLAGIS